MMHSEEETGAAQLEEALEVLEGMVAQACHQDQRPVQT